MNAIGPCLAVVTLSAGVSAAVFLSAPGSASSPPQPPKPAPSRSTDDVQADVDAMNASMRQSEHEFEKSLNRPRPSDVQIASFQAEADKACVCADRSAPPGKDNCWAKYKAMTKPYQPQELSSACLVTTVVDVFPGNKSVSLNQCTAKREAAELAEAAGEELANAC